MTILHVVSDLDEADRWYRDVFGSLRLFRRSHAGVGGSASRHSIGDITIEPVQAAVGAGTNVAAFHRRFGEGLYSTAWLVQDLPTAYTVLCGLDVRLYDVSGAPLTTAPGSDAMFTHPRDSYGLLEFASDARHRETSAEAGEPVGVTEENPLGLREALSIELGADEPIRAAGFFEGLAVACAVPSSDEVRPGGGAWPFGVRPALRITDRAANHEGPFGVTFAVDSVASVVQHLERNAVDFEQPHPGVVRTRPGCSFGAVFSFIQQRRSP